MNINNSIGELEIDLDGMAIKGKCKAKDFKRQVDIVREVMGR